MYTYQDHDGSVDVCSTKEKIPPAVLIIVISSSEGVPGHALSPFSAAGLSDLDERWLQAGNLQSKGLLLQAELVHQAAGGGLAIGDAQKALPHSAWLLASIDRLPDAGLAVVVGDGASLGVVGTQTLPQGLLVVV